MQKERRNKVHNQRSPLLQLGSDHQRCRSRRHREDERERFKDWLDESEQELGSELAI